MLIFAITFIDIQFTPLEKEILMKRVSVLFSVICLLFVGANAIGLQHGLFRSQSTQGTPWQGTATIVQEHFDITVNPDYLDVELEWVFEANGTAPAEHRDALEIVGNLNLVDNSVVVSMITWYKGMILKGKLKTNDVAREQYENVVDRDSDAPPPPRDPVLLEYIRDDNYDISIFPVTFGEARKVRIRYLIPAFDVNGINKIAYPHAFTSNATVTIRLGAGVKGYSVAASDSSILFDKTGEESLSRSVYNFQAYGGSGGKSIKYIVPQLPSTAEGSVLYAGTFSTATMSGEVSHLITMSAENVLRKTSLPEDYVILWRWNHPQILQKYAGQVVKQSKQLKTFLESLTAHKKRAAMIIDMQGGERITFQLDKFGSTEYNRMIKWLDDVASQEIKEPARTTQAQPVIDFDVQKSAQEFSNALQAAMALFDTDKTIARHLILVTAGPQLITPQPITDLKLSFDFTINVSKLSTCVQNEKQVNTISNETDNMYWPGVDINKFCETYGTKLNVTATIGNGVQSYTLQTSLANNQTTTEAHLYSNKSLAREIHWNIKQGDKLLAEYIETPTVVLMENGMQYGRLIGASKYLRPLAEQMPSSIASSLGFIDEKYSLVALEEDALPADIATLYNTCGVPLLDQNDIFPASNESVMTVASWLTANPPELMSKGIFNYYYSQMEPRLGGKIVFDAAILKNVAGTKKAAGIAVQIATTAASVIPETSEWVIYDYLAMNVDVDKSKKISNKVLVSIKNGSLLVDLSLFDDKELKNLTVAIFDLKGRLIRVLDLATLVNKKLQISTERLGLSRGAYFVKINGNSVKISQKFVVR